MRIFVAGASGAIGRQLVPMLVERGYDVTGTTRGSNLAAIEAMGAQGGAAWTGSTPSPSRPRSAAPSPT